MKVPELLDVLEAEIREGSTLSCRSLFRLEENAKQMVPTRNQNDARMSFFAEWRLQGPDSLAADYVIEYLNEEQASGRLKAPEKQHVVYRRAVPK